MFKKYLFSTIIFSLLLSSFAFQGRVFATDKYGLYDTAYKAGLMDTAIAKKSNPLEIAADVLGIALSFLGIIFFGIMLYAGIRWMTALGDANTVETSKQMIESAGIGLVIILASYAIATYVFTYLGIG